MFHFGIRNTSKRFGFVSILSFDIGKFVLSLRFCWHHKGPCKHSHASSTVSRPLLALSQAQQHSHSREKVPVNSLLQAKRVLVDSRGLESALEAVRVSVEAVRVSVEAVRVSIEALRCLRGLREDWRGPWEFSWGRESVAEAKKGPVEVVREPVGKNCFKKLWNTSKRFGFVPKFLD